MRRFSLALPAVLLVCACNAGLRREVDTYLADYAKTYQELYYESQKAEWASNTHIVAGDTTNASRTKRADEALYQVKKGGKGGIVSAG